MWENGIRQGEGTMTYATGESYSGGYHLSLADGKGKYVFVNGDTYEGTFKRAWMQNRCGRACKSSRWVGLWSTIALHGPQIININLGTSKGTSVLELLNTFQRINNINVPYEFAERRIGDYCTVIADNSKAISLLDWIPKRSLNEMCIDGWKWQSENPNGYF